MRRRESLDGLSDLAFSPNRRRVTELGLEQMWLAIAGSAGWNVPDLALPTRSTAVFMLSEMPRAGIHPGAKGMKVGIRTHLVGLRIGPARMKADGRRVSFAPPVTWCATPPKTPSLRSSRTEGITRRKGQRNEGAATARAASPAGLAATCGQKAATRSYEPCSPTPPGLHASASGFAAACGSSYYRLEPERQLGGEGIQLTGTLPLRITMDVGVLGVLVWFFFLFGFFFVFFCFFCFFG